MKRMKNDDAEWVPIDLPETLVSGLSDSDEVLLFGVSYDEEQDKYGIVMGGYGVRLENLHLYHRAMATCLLQQLQEVLKNAHRVRAVINLLQTKADELETEINEYVDGIAGTEVNAEKVIEEMTGLLGTCMGQLRSLAGIAFDEDDVLGGFSMKELADEVQGTAGGDPAAGDQSGTGTGEPVGSGEGGAEDGPEHGDGDAPVQ